MLLLLTHSCVFMKRSLISSSQTHMLYPPLTRIHDINTTINHLLNITDITNSFDFGKISIFEEVRILVNWLQHAYLNAKHVEPSSEVTCDKTDFCFIPKVDASPDQAETALRVTQQQQCSSAPSLSLCFGEVGSGGAARNLQPAK